MAVLINFVATLFIHFLKLIISLCVFHNCKTLVYLELLSFEIVLTKKLFVKCSKPLCLQYLYYNVSELSP